MYNMLQNTTEMVKSIIQIIVFVCSEIVMR